MCSLVVIARHFFSTVPVDGHWSDWSDYGPCSTSCGPGTKTRTRTCDNPKPENGGEECLGNGSFEEECHRGACTCELFG